LVQPVDVGLRDRFFLEEPDEDAGDFVSAWRIDVSELFDDPSLDFSSGGEDSVSVEVPDDPTVELGKAWL
jgi:hypothetical protein